MYESGNLSLDQRRSKMLNGLWSFAFRIPGNWGGGAIVIQDGRVLGGDGGFTYIGTINEVGGKLKGSVAVKHVNTNWPPLIPGLPSYELSVDGSVQGDSFTLHGTVVGVPAAPQLVIEGKKQVALCRR